MWPLFVTKKKQSYRIEKYRKCHFGQLNNIYDQCRKCVCRFMFQKHHKNFFFKVDAEYRVCQSLIVCLMYCCPRIEACFVWAMHATEVLYLLVSLTRALFHVVALRNLHTQWFEAYLGGRARCTDWNKLSRWQANICLECHGVPKPDHLQRLTGRSK